PTYFGFTTLGLLLPGTRPVVARELAAGMRRPLGLAVLGLSVALVLATAGQVTAIVVAGDGRDRAAVRTATFFDPGSHRLRLLLARRGGCSARVPHARAALALMPYHDAPKLALRACGE